MATQADQPPVITTPPSFRNMSVEKATPKYVPGVKIWALFGFALLAFQTYVLVKWVTGPNYERVPSGPNEPSDAIKTYATEKIGKLQKYLRAPLQADVTATLERHLHCVDVAVSSGSHRYAGYDESEDMYASIDLVMDKIVRQVRREKASATAKKRHPTTEKI